MEDHREKPPNSGETKPSSSSDFEFGSLSPSSPSQDQEHSPADHLFLNGRLLPHTFPVSRSTSENTFRSNSTSSRSSDSSSPTSYSTPRTNTCNTTFKVIGDREKTNHITCFGPTSEKITVQKTDITCFGPRSGKTTVQKSEACKNKEYKLNHHKTSYMPTQCKKINSTTTRKKISYMPTQCKRKKATEIVTAQLYGSYTRQWQHITPVFKREGSVKSSHGSGGGFNVGGRKKKTAKKKAEERRGSKLLKWLKRILKGVVLACRECHAMEPQRVVKEEG